MKKSGIKVLGTHCYLGGFLIGLQMAGFKVVKSLEVWNPGLVGAQKLGLPSEKFSFDKISSLKTKADIIVGNPPCSRFSHLSLSFFKKESHKDIKTFPEILDLARTAKQAGAKTIWWETGPLAWSLGKPLLSNFHKYLQKIWGQTTTLLIRIDLRSIGIPQKRPRIHIIHRATKLKPPGCPRFLWPPTIKVGDWVQLKTKDYEFNNPVCQDRIKNPLKWAEKQNREMTFRSMVPKVISAQDWHTNAVVSRRLMIWKEKNRWFDLLEHAALMTYPLERITHLVTKAKTPLSAQVLISKSVAPEITKWVAQKILLPWVNQKNNSSEIVPVSYQEGIWELDLSIAPKMEKAFRSGQETFL